MTGHTRPHGSKISNLGMFDPNDSSHGDYGDVINSQAASHPSCTRKTSNEKTLKARNLVLSQAWIK